MPKAAWSAHLTFHDPSHTFVPHRELRLSLRCQGPHVISTGSLSEKTRLAIGFWKNQRGGRCSRPVGMHRCVRGRGVRASINRSRKHSSALGFRTRSKSTPSENAECARSGRCSGPHSAVCVAIGATSNQFCSRQVSGPVGPHRHVWRRRVSGGPVGLRRAPSGSVGRRGAQRVH